MSTPSNRTGGAATKAESPRGTPGPPEPPTNERPSQRPGGPESLVGRILSGRYFIERVIGEGGMGAVYQAEHTHMHKRLAVKVLHPEMSRLPEVVARFEREAMAAAHIEHPNVAAATDFGKLDDGSFFLVLEYVEGKSLREAIAPGRMELGRAIHVTRQIASALARAHALGIVHRDLKPENVMLVRRDDDEDFVKVLDFGIAKVPVGSLVGENKAPGQALTQLGMVYGTPEYMAPEQALGQAIDLRADLYAVGAMAFEMMTGARPFDHESKVTLLGMHVTAPVPRMSERAPDANIPPSIEAIVTRLLSKEATARHADAKELIEELDTAAVALAEQGRISDPFPTKSTAGSSRASMADTGPRSALATNPTVGVSQPGLASLVGASIGTGLKGWSPWTRRKIATVAGAALGAVLLVVVGVLVAGSIGGGAAPTASSTPSAGFSAPLPPPPPPDPTADAVVSAAQAKIDKGDFATAIDELTAVEKTNPERADVHMLLERAFTGVRNAQSAMREVALWLAIDPNAVTDIHLQEDVRNAALVRDVQDEAFSLLETKMGMRGIDILFDIAYGASGRMYPQAAARAKRELDAGDVRRRASPALGALIAFREAKTCDQKHALLDLVRDKGDARLLTELRPYEATRGCGFLGRSDCYPCMHHDHELEEARQAIAERAKAQQ
ncbi:MAG TPA: serine/threonine-protein kinase [Polyangiaceae bacterium]|jgi:serine/threonine-protein kinase|nr:serine/threonine-protein kinase [Polyangiaceae bacterium]